MVVRDALVLYGQVGNGRRGVRDRLKKEDLARPQDHQDGKKDPGPLTAGFSKKQGEQVDPVIRPSITDTPNGERPLYDTLRFTSLQGFASSSPTFSMTPAFLPRQFGSLKRRNYAGVAVPGSACHLRMAGQPLDVAGLGVQQVLEKDFQHLSTTCCFYHCHLGWNTYQE
jgi:hypothetical protein